MKVYSVYEAKTNLSRLIKETLAGEEVAIAYRGQEQLVILVRAPSKKQKKLGFLEGQVTMSDDFNEPLADFDEYQR